jgi:hypothetical protein
MFATLATFHLPMSALNVGLLENSEAMLVTAAVFQPAMSPYFVVVAVEGEVAHAVTASPMLVSVKHIDREVHVGYAFCSVDPQLAYTPRLMHSVSPTPSKAEEKVVTRSTFHEAMFALNAVACENACVPTARR